MLMTTVVLEDPRVLIFQSYLYYLSSWVGILNIVQPPYAYFRRRNVGIIGPFANAYKLFAVILESLINGLLKHIQVDSSNHK